MSGRIFAALLILAVMVSAVGVIYSKHRNRMLYVELTRLQQQQDELNVDWGRLQLEQSTWATHGRIETVARNKLGMRNVDYSEVVILKDE
ncbi:MAG: cell division protein FtsL [Gammaproteobacteria bacterium]|nr:cell division protein FtsL [Gammaproteobacteria bacterium]